MRLIILFFISFFLKNCNHEVPSELPKGDNFSNLDRKSYVFSAISLTPPGVSHIYSYDFTSGKVTELLSAQSSDPLLFQDSQGELFLFNRTATSANMVTFKKEGGTYKKDSSYSLPYVPGAPYDVVRLSADILIMSYYGSGELVLYSLKEKKVIAQNKIDTSPRSFHPQRLILTENTLYVISHGIDKSWNPDGNQGIYAFRREEGFIDFEKPLFYPLHSTFPQLVRQNKNELIFAGLCYTISGPNCTQAIDSFSLNDRTTTQLRDLINSPYNANGNFTRGLKEGEFLTSVQDKNQSKYIVSISEKEDITSPIFQFAAEEGGYFLLDSLPEKNLLIYGSQNKDGQTGRLTIQIEDKKTSVDLPLVPYQGVFVR